MKKTVLGIKIDDVSLEDAINIVGKWLENRDKHYIVTPNPEFLMTAQQDLSFKDILNKADLAIPDGVGLKLASDIENTTSGIDLMEGLIKLAAEKGVTVGFLGGRDRVAELCAERLSRKYPKLKISFSHSGDEVDKKGNVLSIKYYIPNTDLLFVAFGVPKQEYWIAQNLDKIPVGVAMGVGGAFDYLSGKVARAPKWIRDLGFEWLFRLVVQPWRIKRQLALVKFVYWTFVK